jgi:CubicO group peptidase (beta-lactamase class C family)
MRASALSALLSTLFVTVCAPRSPTRSTGGDVASFGTAISELRLRYNIPGLSGLVLRDDTVMWEQSLGERNVEANQATTPGTLFHLASLTKPFAAVIAMQLVQERRLRLEQPLTDFGVTLAAQDTVRVWHIMSHTSQGRPGTSYAYSGDRFGLLDGILQRASGKSFAQLFDERIRRPLGLAQTAPNPQQAAAFGATGLSRSAITDSLARGYDYSRARRNMPVAYASYFGTAAGLISTPRDYARFVRALDGEGLLTTGSKARMFTPIVSPAGDTLPYALGWFVQRYRGVTTYWHYGLWTGTSTLVVRVPERHLTFVLFANNEMLSAPFRLGAGDLLSSPFAQAFFRTFVD